ncbi:hypothetical protein CQA58_05695 [Helicobacter brantae]|uniref:Uncharacterized protein n=1 Tax=Helicobacter brantae TaxID=375927 RepID=A0A3D8IYJ2_9HELI|nr:hypothetical protein CQA58_05695 [Helicobacter brantae]
MRELDKEIFYPLKRFVREVKREGFPYLFLSTPLFLFSLFFAFLPLPFLTCLRNYILLQD